MAKITLSLSLSILTLATIGCGGTPSAPIAHTPVVVFFGDSIIAHWSEPAPLGGVQLPYPNAINKGVPGDRTSQLLARFDADVVALHPDVVIILGGINDLDPARPFVPLSDTQANFEAMIAKAKANNIRLVLSTTLPQCAFSTLEMNAMIRNEAAVNGLTVADYFPALAQPDNTPTLGMFYDCTHPNLQGYEVMDPIALAAINKSLGL